VNAVVQFVELKTIHTATSALDLRVACFRVLRAMVELLHSGRIANPASIVQYLNEMRGNAQPQFSMSMVERHQDELNRLGLARKRNRSLPTGDGVTLVKATLASTDRKLSRYRVWVSPEKLPRKDALTIAS
jgi:hypothetical protein